MATANIGGGWVFELVKVAPRAIAYSKAHSKGSAQFSVFRSTLRGITKTSQNGENGDKLESTKQ